MEGISIYLIKLIEFNLAEQLNPHDKDILISEPIDCLVNLMTVLKSKHIVSNVIFYQNIFVALAEYICSIKKPCLGTLEEISVLFNIFTKKMGENWK